MGKWWEEFFDEDYVRVYKERDRISAAPEAAFVRKALSLRKGQRVLDICCGYGRHAVLLAQTGLAVTGIDYNALFLRRARKAARAAEIEATFVEGDVRVMEFDSTFDAALNLFTSIGFFASADDNYQVVARAAAALKPGGRFLLDTVNRDRLVRNPQWQLWMPMGRGVVLDSPAFDWRRGRLNSRRILVSPDGQQRETRISLRLYTLTEIVEFFERAGLEVTKIFGDFEGAEFGIDSPRIIVVGRKPKPGGRAEQ